MANKFRTLYLNLKKSYYEAKIKEKFDYKLSLKLDGIIKKMEGIKWTNHI